jgi:STE24 endopeptidase
VTATVAVRWIWPAAPTDWFAYLGGGGWQQYHVWGGGAAAAAVVGGYIWLVFGFLSRRCERQADVYGCKVVSCNGPPCQGHDAFWPPVAGRRAALGLCPTGIRVFISALEKVADLNGIRRDQPSWRHSSIARRVEFLHGLLSDTGQEPAFQRRLVLMKWGLLTSLILLTMAFWWLDQRILTARLG